MLQIQGLAAAAISLVHQQKSWLAQLTMLTANNSFKPKPLRGSA
jgi:hypothetical protein